MIELMAAAGVPPYDKVTRVKLCHGAVYCLYTSRYWQWGNNCIITLSVRLNYYYYTVIGVTIVWLHCK